MCISYRSEKKHLFAFGDYLTRAALAGALKIPTIIFPAQRST
jgi:hypothetical protein